jgi:hypothetical protein
MATTFWEQRRRAAAAARQRVDRRGRRGVDEEVAMTHEAEPGAGGSDDLPETIKIEPLPYEEFLARFPDDRPDDDELVRRATENSRG